MPYLLDKIEASAFTTVILLNDKPEDQNKVWEETYYILHPEKLGQE